jgi:hypothetical protein
MIGFKKNTTETSKTGVQAGQSLARGKIGVWKPVGSSTTSYNP